MSYVVSLCLFWTGALFGQEMQPNKTATAFLESVGKKLDQRIFGDNRVQLIGKFSGVIEIGVAKGERDGKPCYKITEKMSLTQPLQVISEATGLLAPDLTVLSFEKKMTQGDRLIKVEKISFEGGNYARSQSGPGVPEGASKNWIVKKSAGYILNEAQYLLMRLLTLRGKADRTYLFVSSKRTRGQELVLNLLYTLGKTKKIVVGEEQREVIELTMQPKHPLCGESAKQLRGTYWCDKQKGGILAGEAMGMTMKGR